MVAKPAFEDWLVYVSSQVQKGGGTQAFDAWDGTWDRRSRPITSAQGKRHYDDWVAYIMHNSKFGAGGISLKEYQQEELRDASTE